MTAEKTCRATLYSESPSFMIPSSLKQNTVERDASGWQCVGHAFIGITDEKGKETFYSFGPEENENATNLETIKATCFSSKTKGALTTNIEPYDDKLVFKISREDYDKIKTFSDDKLKNTPNYNLFSYSCITFAYEALKKANLKLPKQPVIASPAVASLGIRALDAKRTLAKKTAKILSSFSLTKNLSKKIFDKIAEKRNIIPIGVKKVSNAIKLGVLTKNGILAKKMPNYSER